MKGRVLLMLTFIAAAGSVGAQSWEVSLLAGHTPSSGLDRQAPELDQLDIGGGLTWGAQAARALSPRWSADVLWTDQSSGLVVETGGNRADLFTFNVAELHGDAVYHFANPDARLRPFAFVGLGATFFRGADLPSETKLSWGLGGGVKFHPWSSVGLRAHARYKATILNDESAEDFCDPFGFCQGWLGQFELMGGVVLRF